MRYITVKQLLDAVRKNGLPKITGKLLIYGYEVGRVGGYKPIAGCAMGQAALNLNVPAKELEIAFSRLSLSNGLNITGKIEHLNDSTDKSLEEIANMLEEEFDESTLNRMVTVN
jgi:hypothetical protein